MGLLGDDPGVGLLVVIVAAVVVASACIIAGTTLVNRISLEANFWSESSPSAVIERRAARIALEKLRSACRARGDLPPDITALALSDSYAAVYLRTPRDDAPSPWRASDDGVMWRVALDELDAQPLDVPAVSSPDALVGFGRTADASVFIDLAASPGIVNVVGNRRLARKLVRRWIAECTEPGWRVDFSVGIIDDVSLLSGRAMGWPRAMRADAGRDFSGGYLAVANAERADVVEAMIARSRLDAQPGAAGVVIGSVRAAPWTLTVGARGLVRSDVLPNVDLRDPFALALLPPGRDSRSAQRQRAESANRFSLAAAARRIDGSASRSGAPRS